MEKTHRVLGQLCDRGPGHLTSWSFSFLCFKNGHKESYFKGARDQWAVPCSVKGPHIF